MKLTVEPQDPRAVYLEQRTIKGPGEDDCWVWKLKPDRDGYGVANFDHQQWRAHRLSYTHHVGPIPAGHELDHTCEQRICVRPSHLQPVESNFENFVRKFLREGRTREEAEVSARWHLEQIELDHGVKLASREAAAAAEAAGVGVGSRVRRGRSRTGAIWIVRRIRADRHGEAWAYLESETAGRPDTVRVEELKPA